MEHRIGFYMLEPKRDHLIGDRATLILTWGGLRGGISVAMVLSLPPSPYRDVLITMTYIGVVFSILAQGLTIERLVRASSWA